MRMHARADRSPGEFYQLDIEMSFVTQDDVFNTIEPLMFEIFSKFSNKKFLSLLLSESHTLSLCLNMVMINLIYVIQLKIIDVTDILLLLHLPFLKIILRKDL